MSYFHVYFSPSSNTLYIYEVGVTLQEGQIPEEAICLALALPGEIVKGFVIRVPKADYSTLNKVKPIAVYAILSNSSNFIVESDR